MSTASVGRNRVLGPVISLVIGALAAFLLVWALLMAVSPGKPEEPWVAVGT